MLCFIPYRRALRFPSETPELKIDFRLSWHDKNVGRKGAFKSPDARALILEYASRISKFTSCSLSGNLPRDYRREAAERLWLCDLASGAKMLTSEELAASLRAMRDGGVRTWTIVIGGPDGFTKKQRLEWQPDFRWSFGPLTLPHELAAAVACEQVYRAFTIVKGLPYHSGHRVVE